jgi:hypothetical protein
MTRTLVHGNKARKAEHGFVLLDAILCLFIAGIILGIVFNTRIIHSWALDAATEHTGHIIEERNRIDRERLGIDERP